MRILEAALSALLLCSLHSLSVKGDKKCSIDVIAVLDGSDSISSDDFIKLKTAVTKLADWVSSNDTSVSSRLGAVVYSSGVTDSVGLSHDTAHLKEKIMSFHHPQDGTATDLGIAKMNEMFSADKKKGVPQVGIVITDGKSKNTTATVAAAQTSHDAGIRMVAVGVGLKVDTDELNGIASSSADVKTITQFAELEALVARLLKQFCVVDGGWSEWTEEVSECSAECGFGVITHSFSRTCTQPSPKNGGLDCKGDPTKVETESCLLVHCPVDGGWSEWTEEVSECSAECGFGVITHSFSRTCTQPSPKNGGLDCKGDPTKVETESCLLVHCPVDGGWSEWTEEVSECSAECGFGVITHSFSRTCTQPSPKNGGLDCKGDPTKVETESCLLVHCPVPGGWSPWTAIPSGCSVTCGEGVETVTSTRTCSNPTPKYGGADCSDKSVKYETRTCTLDACAPDPCAGCRYENGVGYVADESDCHKFLQCVDYGKRYHTMTCRPATFWSQDKLTCIRSSTHCTAKISITAPDDDAGVWVARCDGSKRPLSGDRSKYEEKVPGRGWLVRNCAPGTVYETYNCTCVLGGSATHSCKPKLFIPFTDSVEDRSENKVHVDNNGVEITKGGLGNFKDNTGIWVNRFSNAYFGYSVTFTFQMQPTGSVTGRGRAVMSNSHCDEEGSIYIIDKGTFLDFLVYNTDGVKHVLRVEYTRRKSGLNSVALQVADGVVKATVDSVTKSSEFKGPILSVHCALHVGQATGYDNYIGLIDNFKVTFC